MSKPTIDEIAYAVYVSRVNMDGICAFCRKNMSGMPPDYKEWHFQQEHTEQPQPPTSLDKEKKL